MLRHLLILTAFIASAFVALAAPKAPAYTPLPLKYDGSMMPLDTAVYGRVSVPDSLQPFFIDYLSRHGARYMSSRAKTRDLEALMASAEKSGTISAQGREFNALLKEVVAASEGNWGLLSKTGKAEQQFMARWLLSQFPGVMGSGGIVCQSSYVPRVVQTMYGLTETLVTTSTTEPQLRISTAEGLQFSPLMRYFTTDSLYAAYLDKGPWRAVWNDWASRNLPTEPARRLYGKECSLTRTQLQAVSFMMYGVLQSLRSSDLGVATTQWMTGEEYRACWEAENLDKYLKRTWTSVSDEPVRAAVPLLRAMVGSADQAIMELARGVADEQRTHAVMRFGHAETLMPVLALMGVPGCFATVDDPDQVSEYWHSYDVVPMGANFLTVLLRSRTGRVYAMTCLNGRWVDPLRDGRRIVPYIDLRAYWLSRASAALHTR